MTASSKLLELTERIYQCATERALWPETLEAVRQHLNFDWIALFGCGAEPGSFLRYYDSLGDEDHWREYEHYYKYINPVSRYLKSHREQRVFHDALIIGADEVASTEFMNWAARYDARHILGVALVRLSNDIQIYLSFQRGAAKGEVTRGEIEAMELLAPHLDRALRMSHDLTARHQSVPIMDAVLDSYVAGIAVLSASGKITRTNTAFDQIAKSHHCLSVNDDRLHISDNAVQQELERKLCIAFQRRRQGETPEKDQILFRTANGDVFVGVYLHPLPPQPVFEFCTEDAIMLVVHSSANYSPVATERFAAHFRLTATEKKVLESLLLGYFLEEHAERYDISIGTVRWHMQNILQKTRTRNQTQLVRAVSSMLFYRY